MKMSVYVCGPMSPASFGLDYTPPGWEFNHPAFHAKAAELRAQGFSVINPAEHDAEIGLDQPWATYLRRDLVLLAEQCDSIALLPGWEKSKGARLEHHVGKELGMKLIYPDDSASWSPTTNVSVVSV